MDSISETSLWSSGPDELVPSNSLYSTKLDQAVMLRSKPVDQRKYPYRSVYTVFNNTRNKIPHQNAIAYKQNDSWCFFSYDEYFQMCNKAAKSFIKLGLKPSQSVAIIGFNAPQWNISCIGAIFAGGVSCGVYTTNTPEACEYVLLDTKAPIVVVENKQQLDKILKCVDNGKVDIKKIVQYTGEVTDDRDGLIMPWKDFIDYGQDLPDANLKKAIKTIAPNKCALLIYTSGTTGNPKGAMISHDSVGYLVQNIADDQCRMKFGEESFISYLPLSHIAAQSIDIYCCIYIGGCTYFAQPDAMKGSLSTTMQEVRPTFFFGVPRVLEKFQEKLSSTIKNLTGVKANLFKWAQEVSSNHLNNSFAKKKDSINNLKFFFAKLLVLNKIHKKLGLDKCRYFVSGAAPVTKETLDFFIKIGLPTTEVYGMSETTGPHSIGTTHSNRVTSVGPIDQFNRSKIVNKDDEDSGELCIYGRHLFMGYLNNIEKTRETYDEQGWLHTGDIAKIDSDGYLYITGRLKELIITAGGENIPPVPIEDKIKAELPDIVNNCMLVGDKKKYLVVLVTLKCKINPDTQEPLDELTSSCVQWLQSIGSNSTKASDICNNKDSLVYQKIDAGIRAANQYSTSRAAKVQKFTILQKDFSLTNGELGPTLKLKRPIVMKMYTDEIEKLYSENTE